MNRLGWINKRSQLMGSAAAAVIGACLAPTQADAAFQIPAESLPRALQDFGAQSGLDIIADSRLTANKHSQGVRGVVSPDAALASLLKGTGLTYRHSDDAVMIMAAEVRRPAPAAPLAPAQAGVETVVVTAQHKSENIQQVPIAITALSQEQLTARQIAGGPDLLRDVPNMNFTKTNFSGYDIELRGIGTQAISVTTDPAVAVAFNDTPFIRNHFFEQEFFDLQDVEVLLGPQGTLYGRNATAGVVNLKSALPDDSYQAMLSADLGNFANRRLEAMLNIPIVGDKLDIRFAGEWTKRDGYTTDTTLNIPVDGRDLWSGRMTIGWKPIPELQTYFVWEHFQEDDDRLRSGKQLCETSNSPTSVGGQPVPSGNYDELSGLGEISAGVLSQGCQATSLYASTAFEVPNGFSLPYIIALGSAFGHPVNSTIDPYAEVTQSTNLRQIESEILPTYRAKNDTLEFNATYSIDPALTLTSLTGFNQDFLWSTEDYNRFDTSRGIFTFPNDFPCACNGYYFPDPAAGTYGIPSNAALFCDPQLGCSDRILAEDLDKEHAWQFSQEFRLASNYAGPFNFSVGANYLHYETQENYYVFINALTGYAYGGGDHFGDGSTRDHSDCMQKERFYGGWQSPNPVLGGGEPDQVCIFIDTNPISHLNDKGHNYFLSQNPYLLNSYAGFGESYFNFTPDLKLTTGLRWTVDQKRFVNIPSNVVDQGYGYFKTGIENQEWQRLTGRAVLNWTPKLDFTDQSMFYASYAHGYKAGGANPPGAVFPAYGTGQVPFVDHPLTFKPEYIEAFELGTKNTLRDNSLTLNGDIFYYNYTGYQISEIVDRTAINNNYNAHVEGAEIQANWEPVPGLKFNFAGGWEDTAAAGGDSGIDLMDRTAGMPGWMVVKPFPTQASNCILPTYVVAALLQEQAEGAGAVGFACETAYIDHLDPVSGQPYVPNPVGISAPPPGTTGTGFYPPIPTGYPGFNPDAPAINNGEGFLKNLSGHSLPNAPPFTISLGGEYTMPVTEDWAATLRGDFYWQADSWARIFNDNPYDRIHGYTNFNLALVLNSANGWQVMGYIKNVFNTTAITGDFLNSDDSGLTTNIFLTDPRLYGIRVTKQLDDGDGFWGADYSGSDFFTGLFSDKDGRKPELWVELGGQAEHIAGQGEVFTPGFMSVYPDSAVVWKGTTPTEAQKPPNFSYGEEAKVSYEPDDSDWIVSAALRYGRSGDYKEIDHQTNGVFFLTYKYGVPKPGQNPRGIDNFSDTHAAHRESHTILDFTVGKDVGLGMLGLNGSSVVNAGLRYAQFASSASVDIRARPDLAFKYQTFGAFGLPGVEFKLPYFHTYHVTGTATRKFHGVGPSISWNGSTAFAGEPDSGELTFDWGANGALLFGKQKARVLHHASGHYVTRAFVGNGQYFTAYNPAPSTRNVERSVTVPNIGGFVGFSWRYNNAKISLGYRADFFIGAIDGGIDKRHSETLNMSGPFATISFGIGG